MEPGEYQDGSQSDLEDQRKSDADTDAAVTSEQSPPPIKRSSSILTVENLKLHEEALKDRGNTLPSPSSDLTGRGAILNTTSRTSTTLGSVRCHSRSDVDVSVDRGESLRTGSGRPLPPIGADRSSGEIVRGEVLDEETGRVREEDDLHTQTSHPAILQRPFRRESLKAQSPDTDTSGSAKSSRPERNISFLGVPDSTDPAPPMGSPGRASPAVREVHHNIINGEERVSISIATETEWSWLQSLKIAGVEDEVTSTTEEDVQKVKTQYRMSTPSHDSDLSDMDDIGDTERDKRVVPPLEIDAESEYSETELTDREHLIPSIGPPRIIQYQKEVYRPYSNDIPFCGEEEESPGPLPAISDVSIHLPEIQEEETYCEYCHKEIKQFPTPEMRDQFTNEELYCCEEYQKFVEFAMLHSPLEAEPSDELIDIAPHAPYGSKQARRAAKERAAARLREREMARQRAAGANQANFYAFARQMKTINYALSSQRCMDEGWTIRPVTPDDTPPPPLAYEPVMSATPSLRPQIRREEMKRGPVLERFYPGGETFMIMFKDGSGTVYYPSGSPAIQIVRVQAGQFIYIAQDEVVNGRGALLALFEPNGRGTCYHRNGNIRLNLDQSQGLFADSKGAVKKRWHWWDHSTHVHAPPFQPICFALNSVLSVRCLAQDQVFLGYSQDKMNLRFNVGVKLKLVAPENIPAPEVDEDALYISEVRAYVQLVMDKIGNQLQFSKSPKVGGIHPPRNLKNVFLRNDQRKQEMSKKRAAGRETPIVTVK